MKTGYTHIAIILDRSGSMASCVSDTKGGFNAFIDEQRKIPGEATLTLVQFDDQYELVHDGIALKDVPPLGFVPRGQTALFDAIGRSIDDTGKWLAAKAEADRPEKVVVVILTDGQENASQKFTQAQVFDKIRHQESTYRWQFVFIGANQDAILSAAKIGIQAFAALTMDANAPSVAFAATSRALSMTRTSSAPMGYTDADREANQPKS